MLKTTLIAGLAASVGVGDKEQHSKEIPVENQDESKKELV